jgi:hypothetical protein
MKHGPRPAGRPWTPAEDAQLLALIDSKMDRPLIARKLKRTVSNSQATGHLEQTRAGGARAEGEGQMICRAIPPGCTALGLRAAENLCFLLIVSACDNLTIAV